MEPQIQPLNRPKAPNELLQVLHDFYYLDTKDFVSKHGLGWNPLRVAREAKVILETK